MQLLFVSYFSTDLGSRVNPEKQDGKCEVTSKYQSLDELREARRTNQTTPARTHIKTWIMPQGLKELYEVANDRYLVQEIRLSP